MNEAEWVAQALNKQGDLVRGVMAEIGEKATKETILKAVNKKGHAFELHHVTAALKNLIAREIAKRVGREKYALCKD